MGDVIQMKLPDPAQVQIFTLEVTYNGSEFSHNIKTELLDLDDPEEKQVIINSLKKITELLEASE